MDKTEDAGRLSRLSSQGCPREVPAGMQAALVQAGLVSAPAHPGNAPETVANAPAAG